MKPELLLFVTPLSQMQGDDDEDARLLRAMQREATDYLRRQRWCDSILDCCWGGGVGGIVSVFLFHVKMHDNESPEEWVWVVCGDLPPLYLDTDVLVEPREVLVAYCDLVGEWIEIARRGGDLRSAVPIAATPTAELIGMLESRLKMLRELVIPEIAARVSDRRTALESPS